MSLDVPNKKFWIVYISYSNRKNIVNLLIITTARIKLHTSHVLYLFSSNKITNTLFYHLIKEVDQLLLRCESTIPARSIVGYCSGVDLGGGPRALSSWRGVIWWRFALEKELILVFVFCVFFGSNVCRCCVGAVLVLHSFQACIDPPPGNNHQCSLDFHPLRHRPRPSRHPLHAYQPHKLPPLHSQTPHSHSS